MDFGDTVKNDVVTHDIKTTTLLHCRKVQRLTWAKVTARHVFAHQHQINSADIQQCQIREIT